MTQYSFPWNCSPSGGDAHSLKLNDLLMTNQLLLGRDPKKTGVVYWEDTQVPLPIGDVAFSGDITGNLGATNPNGNVVRIASGAAFVYGHPYINDAAVDFDVSGGAANAIDIIALERGDASVVQSVRLVLLRGSAGSKASVTNSSTAWHVPLWEIELDANGDFSELVDVRQWSNIRCVTRFISMRESAGEEAENLGNRPYPVLTNDPTGPNEAEFAYGDFAVGHIVDSKTPIIRPVISTDGASAILKRLLLIYTTYEFPDSSGWSPASGNTQSSFIEDVSLDGEPSSGSVVFPVSVTSNSYVQCLFSRPKGVAGDMTDDLYVRGALLTYWEYV